MLITLDSFAIADGHTTAFKVNGTEQLALAQETDEDVPLRAEWPTFFPDRAVRRVALGFTVTHPPAADEQQAHFDAHLTAVNCPKGGALTVELHGNRISYESAKVVSIQAQRIGLSVLMTYNLEAVNPTSTRLILDEDGVALEDEDGVALEY